MSVWSYFASDALFFLSYMYLHLAFFSWSDHMYFLLYVYIYRPFIVIRYISVYTSCGSTYTFALGGDKVFLSYLASWPAGT